MRPLKIVLEGVVGHVVQGTKILLQCTVYSARPAANVTWQNGTQLVSESNKRFEMFETKVHENVSKHRDIACPTQVISALIQLISLFLLKQPRFDISQEHTYICMFHINVYVCNALKVSINIFEK